MQRNLIVTDLTRFSQKPDKVCIAGVDRRTGECIRPMPYLKAVRCRELNILPGTILAGDFIPSRHREGPHQEDHYCPNLAADGACSCSEFKAALKPGLFDCVEQGFEIVLADRQKHIPIGHRVGRSIITIRVAPCDIEAAESSFEPGKIRLHFTDRSGWSLGFIPITDLGLHTYLLQHHSQDALCELNRWIRSQDEVYLRVGLGRPYQPPGGPAGYWLQVNGLYTFPDRHKGIRSYT